MEIIEFPTTDMADPISVENGNAVRVPSFNKSDHHRTELLLRTEQIENRDIPLRYVSLSYLISLRAYFGSMFWTTLTAHYQ